MWYLETSFNKSKPGHFLMWQEVWHFLGAVLVGPDHRLSLALTIICILPLLVKLTTGYHL